MRLVRSPVKTQQNNCGYDFKFVKFESGLKHLTCGKNVVPLTFHNIK